MTVQSEIYLAQTMTGLRVLEVKQKNTMLPKNTLSQQAVDMIRQAIQNQDDALMAEIVMQLMLAAEQGGWSNAPGGYMMKHNGYMIGLGLFTSSGIKSDLTLTIRSDSPVA